MEKHEIVIAALFIKSLWFLDFVRDFLRVPALVYSNDLYPPQQTILFQHFGFDLHQYKIKQSCKFASNFGDQIQTAQLHCCWQWTLTFEERIKTHRILLLLNYIQISDWVSWNIATLWLTLGGIQCHDFQLQRRTQYAQNGWTSCETFVHNYPIPIGKRRQSESSPMITN